MALLGSVNYTRPYPVNTSTVPSPSNSAVTEDPAESGMGAVKPPENTVHPAFSTSPRSANWLASQATEAAGCPMTAAPAAVATTSPSARSTHPRRRRIFDIPRDHRAGSDQESSGARVVGDDVGQGEPEVLVARVQDIDSPVHRLGGRQHARYRRRGRDVTGEDEGDFRLDAPVRRRPA